MSKHSMVDVAIAACFPKTGPSCTPMVEYPTNFLMPGPPDSSPEFVHIVATIVPEHGSSGVFTVVRLPPGITRSSSNVLLKLSRCGYARLKRLQSWCLVLGQQSFVHTTGVLSDALAPRRHDRCCCLR
ncbi:hypothetical protein H310_06111 [Aphanomyces invadans]|uniref:Uncharacterized protein n=1 Tax=Aphanomyces invadans TaxID=157072 RepID=A0A024U9T4_9STRA|nr:hypothetical protein H310_06111 [Aphanomyces invadans]ETW02652.1 hypothetical protein H310_06111 [Aphanomyces invadans]|eukprot:XP_008869257.1 hypothetical protein H310_06111 [Aphanomyces invadans]